MLLILGQLRPVASVMGPDSLPPESLRQAGGCGGLPHGFRFWGLVLVLNLAVQGFSEASVTHSDLDVEIDAEREPETESESETESETEA